MRSTARDLLFPAAVLGVIGLLILPLPSAVMDLLLSLNIAISMLLLVSCVYLLEPERFTALPTALLFTTLFRLGLNISTTRQILTTGAAPDIVVAFAEFVVQGNLIVGAVIFLVITLIQFLVVAKGAERVAEVAARFTLDAMPGKQMAIDADLRSGVISVDEARNRRLELQRESRFFAALDGAMKFVKGDAIAGILITALNLLAGIGIGVIQLKLSFPEAVGRFSTFTIGDGLVAQIPALLVAVAAGIAVTRVSDKSGSYLGRELISQLTKEPQALITVAVMLVIISLLPGMPGLAFAFGGVVCFVAGIHLSWVSKGKERYLAAVAQRILVHAPIEVRLSPKLLQLMQRDSMLTQQLQLLRGEIFASYGVVAPDVHFSVDEKALIAVSLFGIPLFVRTELEPQAQRESEINELVVGQLRRFLIANLAEFIDDTQVRKLFEIYSPVCEDLIRAVCPELLPVSKLAKLLKALVEEGVSLREMPRILQAIAESSPNLDDAPLLRSVRIAVRRTITARVADSDGVVVVAGLEPELENLIVSVAESRLELDPRIVSAIRQRVIEQKGASARALCVAPAARRLVAMAVKGASDLLVVTPEELLDGTQIHWEWQLGVATSSQVAGAA